MSDPASRILAALAAVESERARRAAAPGFAATVESLKSWQQRRFARTHADLLEHPRFGRAARFFLDELYGPQDFARRDAEFGRIVPAVVRLFPEDIVLTVEALAEVHALSERLDGAMAARLAGPTIDGPAYVRAWQAVGEPQAREHQIELAMVVGRALERHVCSRVLRASLKAMRGPARAAGLGTLQAFLETGFDAFAAMRGADEFLGTIERRERALGARLFEPTAEQAAAAPAADDPLAALP